MKHFNLTIGLVVASLMALSSTACVSRGSLERQTREAYERGSQEATERVRAEYEAKLDEAQKKEMGMAFDEFLLIDALKKAPYLDMVLGDLPEEVRVKLEKP